MVSGWCPAHGHWDNHKLMNESDALGCPECILNNKTRNKDKKSKLVPCCGLCRKPLGDKSKGKKCYYCGAVFTNSEILKIRNMMK